MVRTVAAWNYTNRGQAICGSSSGNWAARTDDRLLTGARYEIQGSNLIVPGRNVLGWWWNVKQGGNFPRPYIDGAAFYEDTLTQVGGAQGRPSDVELKHVLPLPKHGIQQARRLGRGVQLQHRLGADPIRGHRHRRRLRGAPPGWSIFGVRTSNARPSDNKWGDYNTVRRFNPTPNTWVAGAHFIAGTSNCATCASPVFFNFGRSPRSQLVELLAEQVSMETAGKLRLVR